MTAPSSKASEPDASAAAAAHLAELDAQYEAHAAALEEHALLARAAVTNDADELRDRLEPNPPRR